MLSGSMALVVVVAQVVAVTGLYLVVLETLISNFGAPVVMVMVHVVATDVTTLNRPEAAHTCQNVLQLLPDAHIAYVQQAYIDA